MNPVCRLAEAQRSHVATLGKIVPITLALIGNGLIESRYIRGRGYINSLPPPLLTNSIQQHVYCTLIINFRENSAAEYLMTTNALQ